MANRGRRRRRIPQSDLESQESAGAFYDPRPGTLPADYRFVEKREAYYEPRPGAMPKGYPKSLDAPTKYNLVDADLRFKRKFEREYILGRVYNRAPKATPYTLTTFDARPVNTIDFVHTFAAAEQVGGDSFTTEFTVANDRTAILRRLDLRVYMSAASRDVVTGAPTETLIGSFLIDGYAVPQARLMRLDDAICSPTFMLGMSIPLYIIAQGGSVVSFKLDNTAGGTTFALVAPVITGNLILSSGVNPNSEPGTKAPLPVT